MFDLLNEFKALILTADPKATHYFGLNESDPWQPYTVWAEYELDGLHGGDTYTEPVWRVLIERFTKDENDQAVVLIMNTLKSAPGVAFQYSVRRNRELGVLYHAWDCEVSSGTI